MQYKLICTCGQYVQITKCPLYLYLNQGYISFSDIPLFSWNLNLLIRALDSIDPQNKV